MTIRIAWDVRVPYTQSDQFSLLPFGLGQLLESFDAFGSRIAEIPFSEEILDCLAVWHRWGRVLATVRHAG